MRKIFIFKTITALVIAFFIAKHIGAKDPFELALMVVDKGRRLRVLSRQSYLKFIQGIAKSSYAKPKTVEFYYKGRRLKIRTNYHTILTDRDKEAILRFYEFVEKNKRKNKFQK